MGNVSYTVDEASVIAKITPDLIRKRIREGNLKATKIGQYYRISSQDLNEFLGIEVTKEELEKDLKIAKLEAEVKHYKLIVGMVKANMHNLNVALEGE